MSASWPRRCCDSCSEPSEHERVRVRRDRAAGFVVDELPRPERVERRRLDEVERPARRQGLQVALEVLGRERRDERPFFRLRDRVQRGGPACAEMLRGGCVAAATATAAAAIATWIVGADPTRRRGRLPRGAEPAASAGCPRPGLKRTTASGAPRSDAAATVFRDAVRATRSPPCPTGPASGPAKRSAHSPGAASASSSHHVPGSACESTGRVSTTRARKFSRRGVQERARSNCLSKADLLV